MHLESVDRIVSIPLVETSFKRIEDLYGRVKHNNRLFNWYFETAESTIFAAYESVQPAVKLFEAPLKHLDGVMCKSLDLLEQRIPLVYLPPEMVMIYFNSMFKYFTESVFEDVLEYKGVHVGPSCAAGVEARRFSQTDRQHCIGKFTNGICSGTAGRSLHSWGQIRR